VVVDLDGLDRGELTRLATDRVMVDQFKTKNLGDRGFFVGIDDTNVTLPECFEDAGRKVANGTDFRNGFHLWPGVTADFFVPCGGRPGSVTISNVNELFDSATQLPRFKYIVEGANLFVTDAARDVLQERGVSVFKDASTNKGGVTSSSLEVLAGLAMSEKNFATHMTVGTDGSVPAYYEQYAADLCEIVERNATNEFELIWSEMQKSGRKPTELTDTISAAMNDLNDRIGASDLFENTTMRQRVLCNHFPKSLLEKEGYESVCDRVPVNYQKAIFSMGVAAEFVYKHGPFADSFKFYEFMTQLQAEEK
jgi:glutamate dehydrogenase|tara:strand:+ start:1558 stop:2484 length:927 start_codon:yes stop_codon:yes gene_type:complete